MRIISIANQKGGVGKTTTAINLSSILSLGGERVLLIDADPQANATGGLGIAPEDLPYSLYDVLIRGRNIRDVIIPTEMENLFLIPANKDLAGAEVELVNEFSRETRLRKALKNLNVNFNFIIIDCPPSLGLLTINALAASDSLIIPLQCEYFALEGLARLMDTIDLVKEHLNPSLKIEGILLTMYDVRNNLSKEVEVEVRKHFGDLVFKTIIPRNVRLSEAPSFGKPIILYDMNCKGAESYISFAREFTGMQEVNVG